MLGGLLQKGERLVQRLTGRIAPVQMHGRGTRDHIGAGLVDIEQGGHNGGIAKDGVSSRGQLPQGQHEPTQGIGGIAAEVGSARVGRPAAESDHKLKASAMTAP